MSRSGSMAPIFFHFFLHLTSPLCSHLFLDIGMLSHDQVTIPFVSFSFSVTTCNFGRKKYNPFYKQCPHCDTITALCSYMLITAHGLLSSPLAYWSMSCDLRSYPDSASLHTYTPPSSDKPTLLVFLSGIEQWLKTERKVNDNYRQQKYHTIYTYLWCTLLTIVLKLTAFSTNTVFILAIDTTVS